MSASSTTPKILEARQLMADSEHHRSAGAPQGLDLAASKAREAMGILKALDPSAPEARRLLAHAWKLWGLAEEERCTAEGRKAALQAYDEAKRIFLTVLDVASPLDQHELASLWMHRGMTLLGSTVRAELHEAAQCFQQAIMIREVLPLETNWLYGWGLAASFMNRGDALTRLGAKQEVAEAVRCYGRALYYLSHLPKDANMDAVKQREMVALLNRGVTLQAQKTPESLRAALQSFEAAIALLRHFGAEEQPAYQRTLASALVNKANALLDAPPGHAQEARDSLREALSRLSSLEKNDLAAAEASLKARHTMCRALTALLESSPSGNAAHSEDWIVEMTDVVDEALRVAQVWEAHGEARLRPIAIALFRLGSRVFALWQPHFLAEFLLDHLDPERSGCVLVKDREMHAAAQEALLQAAESIRQRSRMWREKRDSGEGAEWFARELLLLEELQKTELRLAELREGYLATKR